MHNRCNNGDFDHRAPVFTGSLKRILEQDSTAFDADKLCNVTAAVPIETTPGLLKKRIILSVSTTLQDVSRWLQPPPDFPMPGVKPGTKVEIPLASSRARLLNEVGRALERTFDGKASKLIESAGGSATKLVNVVTQHLPGFRDHAVYDGDQVFFYKRAQMYGPCIHTFLWRIQLRLFTLLPKQMRVWKNYCILQTHICVVISHIIC